MRRSGLTSETIRQAYENGTTPKDLAKQYGLNLQAIYYHLRGASKDAHKENRGVIRHGPREKLQDTLVRKRVYTLNQHYFDTIDTEEKAYFFGLLCADGSIHRNGYVVSIELQAPDVAILDALKVAAGSNHPYYVSENSKKNPGWQDTNKLTWGSKWMAMKLAEQGMMWNKTQNLIFPTSVPPALVRHFVRGYFDGNGSIFEATNGGQHKSAWAITISSTNAFNEAVAKIMADECGVTYHMKDQNGTNGSVRVDGRFQVAKVGEWLYEGATVWMARKREKFEVMLGLPKERAWERADESPEPCASSPLAA